MKSIFVNMYGYTNSWIMGIIADDIKRISQSMGIECNSGTIDDYNGEDICYHLDYAKAVPIPRAKHNSVFYTHLNDVLKEQNMRSIKDDFDSFICMSPEDAQYLIEIGFDPQKVFGKTLPVRNTYIKPVSIGIFSACYADGRKNEQWLIDYCRDHPDSRLVNFVFVGPGWSRVVNQLAEFGCSFEWHNVSRKMPYEYQFQQNKLASLNYYIYMGMDGGAMGTYDAYAQDVPLCVTFDGFHKSIPHVDFSFDDKNTFFEQMDKIIQFHVDRLDFFRNNNGENYVNWLMNVWSGLPTDSIRDIDKQCLSFPTVAEKKRSQYYGLNYGKVRDFVSIKMQKFLMKKKASKL